MCFQCRWRLHRDDDDESHLAPRREGRLEPAGHLQVLVRDRRRVLSLRPADLLPQVRKLDRRRVSGRKLAPLVSTAKTANAIIAVYN